MYSGQGSQYYHMGKELYDKHPRFRLWMNHCSEIVSPLLSEPLLKVLYSPESSKSKPFDDITFTNPALLSIEYSLTRVLMESGIRPDYLLGYSLGEFAAAVVSGVMSLEDGLGMSVKYAHILKDKTPNSGMLAVIDSSQIIHDFPNLFEKCWLTGRNFNSNFVVSGLSKHIDELQKNLSAKGIICQKLPVNYGFHTELIDPVEADFKALFDTINLQSPQIPVISAYRTEIIDDINHDFFWNVNRYPVEFETTISKMLDDDYHFIDVGPSGTLATFIKYLSKPSSSSSFIETINQFGKDIKTIEKLNQIFSSEVKLV